jgi:hypothetical protein
MRNTQSCSFLIFLMLCLMSVPAMSQDFLDLSDFFKITGSSIKKYEFVTMKETIPPTIDLEKLNFNYYYLHDSAGVRMAKPFDISEDANELQELAWEALLMEEPDTAMVIFEEVLKLSPLYTPAMTGIGQSLQLMGNHRGAIHWYRKAFALNPIDYIACWSLGRAYHEVGSYDSAVTYLLHAWILNRNSPEIQKDLGRIAADYTSQLKNWNWVPQYRIVEQDGKVVVAYQPAWLGYALCQAVWLAEPGFSLSRQITSDYSMFRERECLSCLVNTMSSDEKEKGSSMDPGLIAFKTALEKRLALEFILFEILLPANPDMAFLLDDQRIPRLIAYLKMTRLEKK